MPERHHPGNLAGYRYGFNGKEYDEEVKGGAGTQYDYGFRIYDPRIAKFLSVDPLTKSYPMLTPYQFASNRPIDGVDLDGLEYLNKSGDVDYGITDVNMDKTDISNVTGKSSTLVHSRIGFDVDDLSFKKADKTYVSVYRILEDGSKVPLGKLNGGENFSEMKEGEPIQNESIMRIARDDKPVFSETDLKPEDGKETTLNTVKDIINPEMGAVAADVPVDESNQWVRNSVESSTQDLVDENKRTGKASKNSTAADANRLTKNLKQSDKKLKLKNYKNTPQPKKF